jgi:hypothetical protein
MQCFLDPYIEGDRYKRVNSVPSLYTYIEGVVTKGSQVSRLP